jgi:hypothetical protein
MGKGFNSSWVAPSFRGALSVRLVIEGTIIVIVPLIMSFLLNVLMLLAPVVNPIDWDLASVVQKKRESLREFIQQFCNKRNIIPEVDDKSIIMFFKKGVRDLSLIHKLIMKTPRTSEAMFAIANKYALAEEATLDTRE